MAQQRVDPFAIGLAVGRIKRAVQTAQTPIGEFILSGSANENPMFGIDSMGLDKVDRSILTSLCARFGGGPVGLSTLAIAVAEPPETVEDVYEPYLIQQGLLIRTPRGRVATAAAWQHLGMVPPPSALPGTVDPSLFD